MKTAILALIVLVVFIIVAQPNPAFFEALAIHIALGSSVVGFGYFTASKTPLETVSCHHDLRG